ncbi:hypothetical protein AgCh_001738 [Apium graveolens]
MGLGDEVVDPQEEVLPMDDGNNEIKGLSMQGNVAVDGGAANGNEDAAEFVDLEVVIGLPATVAVGGNGEAQEGDASMEL